MALFDLPIVKRLLAQKGRGETPQTALPQAGNPNFSGHIPPTANPRENGTFAAMVGQPLNPFFERESLQPTRIPHAPSPQKFGYSSGQSFSKSKKQIPPSQPQPIAGPPPGTNRTFKGAIPPSQPAAQTPYSKKSAWSSHYN